MTPQQLQQLTSQILQALGFLIQPTTFEYIFDDTSFKRLLKTVYQNTDVAQLLLQMPDVFALHPSATPNQSALFIKFVSANNDLDKDSKAVILKYYPPEVALVRFEQRQGKVLLFARWVAEPVRSEKLLIPFLAQAMSLSFSKQALASAFSFGLVIS